MSELREVCLNMHRSFDLMTFDMAHKELCEMEAIVMREYPTTTGAVLDWDGGNNCDYDVKVTYRVTQEDLDEEARVEAEYRLSCESEVKAGDKTLLDTIKKRSPELFSSP